jgi:hypothetical protein
MMKYENDELTEKEIIEGFQELINSGIVWKLQGHYGRTANLLIEEGLCTKPEPKREELKEGGYININPYMYVTKDKTVDYGNGEKLRFIVYGAYNAYGLIGTENNGIAILNEKRRDVLVDEISRMHSWVYNIENIQTPKVLVDEFERLTSMTYADICEFINNHPRARYSLS